MGRRRYTTIPALNNNNNVTVTETQEKVEILNEFFAEVCTWHGPTVDPKIADSLSSSSAFLHEFKVELPDVEKLLRRLDLSRACAPPITNPLKAMADEYRQHHRLHHEYYNEVRVLSTALDIGDVISEHVIGFVQVSGDKPFTIHMTSEQQITRYIDYCRSDKYSVIRVDATGSVIRKLPDQKRSYFYAIHMPTTES
ncbi:unnamed protein product [Didymodactylos carnosus]|uniref:Uncharacterized protein n=1 Tax=Didymodactylos carnosus TaxID=1234261 RepID=A0A8S2NM46_9BILA|nr:unnamed protein product [Didymodactylos carnosus]CAF4008359.1 unnamed protein product [Didymodactylos carnosus]